jgi:hypothetical protein
MEKKAKHYDMKILYANQRVQTSYIMCNKLNVYWSSMQYALVWACGDSGAQHKIKIQIFDCTQITIVPKIDTLQTMWSICWGSFFRV